MEEGEEGVGGVFEYGDGENVGLEVESTNE